MQQNDPSGYNAMFLTDQPIEVKSMKKRSLCKQVLLAGSILAVSFACQSKQTDSKSPPPPSQDMDQSAPCGDDDDEDDSPCESQYSEQAAPASEAPAAQIETPAEAPAAKVETPPTPVIEPVAEKAPAVPEAPRAAPEIKAENAIPQLEPVNAVSENSAAPTPAVSASK